MLANIVMSAKVSAILWFAAFVFGKLINSEDAQWVRGKPVMLMMVFYCVGMLGHNVWIVYLTLMASLPLIARSRAEGAALYVVAICAVPELATFMTVGGASILQIDKWLCLSLSLLIVFLKSPRNGLRIKNPFDLPFLLIVGLEVIGIRNQNFTSSVRILLSTLLTLGLPYFIFTRSITKVADLRRVMVAFAFVGFVLATIAVFESRTHFLTYQQMYQSLGVEGVGYKMFKVRGGLLRAVTSFGDATSFSLFLATTMLATIAMRQSFRSTSKLVIALVVIALGIFVTSSRNAWIAVAISVLAVDLYRRRTVALVGKTMLLVMSYAVLALLAEFSPYIATMMGNSGDTASTADYRTQLLTRGIEEFRKHPFFGLDASTVMTNMADMTQGEGIIDFVNGYLFYALVAGVGGMIMLALAFLLPCWAMLASRRKLHVLPLLDRTAAFVFAVSLTTSITTALTWLGGRGATYFYLIQGIGGILYAWRKLPAEMLAATDRPPPKRRPESPVRARTLTFSDPPPRLSPAEPELILQR